jgi:hypothetical protein
VVTDIILENHRQKDEVRYGEFLNKEFENNGIYGVAYLSRQ